MYRLLVLLVLFLSSAACAQTAMPNAEKIQKHIKVLSADKLKGRGTGSNGLKKAAKYIIKHYKKYDLQPMGTDGYRQAFTAKVTRVKVDDSLRETNNIIGFLDNNADYTIVIGAHYDHLGMGYQGSSKAEHPNGKIHNGADDNASGVAGLLEIARYFTQNGLTEPYNFMFIAFSAEELGLLGSEYFVDYPTIALEKIDFMINMDMIGRYNPDRGVGIGGYGTSDAWPRVFEGVESSVKFFTDKAGSGGSDHGSFYAKDIPVLFFHTGGHADYHKPSDDADKINAKAEAAILAIQVQLIKNAMEMPKLEFTEVK